jgi:hypothetical protein
MRQTDYFRRRVLQQRPYIKLEWCEKTVRQSVHTEVQPDGRIRHWLFIPELGKYLRVTTLEDGETLRNAFPDRRVERSPKAVRWNDLFGCRYRATCYAFFIIASTIPDW